MHNLLNEPHGVCLICCNNKRYGSTNNTVRRVEVIIAAWQGHSFKSIVTISNGYDSGSYDHAKLRAELRDEISNCGLWKKKKKNFYMLRPVNKTDHMQQGMNVLA